MLTEEQKDFWYKGFPVTWVSRIDLKDMGFDVSKVTDEQMKSIAMLMGDSYVSGGQFWEDLLYWAKQEGISKIEDVTRLVG